LVYSNLLGMSVCTGADENNTFAWGFVGSIALAGCWGYCISDGGTILVGHWRCRALVQGGLPLVFLAGVLLVCVWCWSSVYAAAASPIFALNLKSGAVVTGVMPRRSRSLVGGQWWCRQWRSQALAAHCIMPPVMRC
jgi:hypothetical protein